MFLGRLGKLLWFRCRDCGTDYHVATDEHETVACPACGRVEGDDITPPHWADHLNGDQA